MASPFRNLMLLLLAALMLGTAACGYKDNLSIPGQPEQEQPDSGKERRSPRR